jgi:hypothetical protein
LGLLATAAWKATPGGIDFRTNIHALNYTNPPGKLTPAIASMGAQGGSVLEIKNPGLATHWQVVPAANPQANEIIYSFNLN